MASAIGPVPADWMALGLVKHVVLPGKQGVAAPADAVSVNTALPRWKGGPAGSAEMVIGTVV